MESLVTRGQSLQLIHDVINLLTSLRDKGGLLFLECGPVQAREPRVVLYFINTIGTYAFLKWYGGESMEGDPNIKKGQFTTFLDIHISLHDNFK